MSAAPCRGCGEPAGERYPRGGSLCWPCFDELTGLPQAESRVHASTNGHRPSAPDRYCDRLLDVPALLAAPDEPIPWRAVRWDFAADGSLTVLAGRGGEGKSWLALRPRVRRGAREAPAAGSR